jgi:hypothetical protein
MHNEITKLPFKIKLLKLASYAFFFFHYSFFFYYQVKRGQVDFLINIKYYLNKKIVVHTRV